MNNVFSFKRFGLTLRHDIIGTANRAGLSMLLGPTIVLLTVALIMQIYDIVFMYGGTGENIPVYPVARFIILCITHFIMMLFMATSSFGYLTDSRSNITQLMLPASTLEKFLSITIIYYIFTPAVIFLAGWAGDTLIALTGLGGFTGYMNPADLIGGISDFYDESFDVGYSAIFGKLAWSFVISYFMIASFTLLCALVFKTYKVLKTIGIYLGLNLVIGNIQTLFWGNKLMAALNGMDAGTLDLSGQSEDVMMQGMFDFLDKSMSYGMIFSIVAFIALSVAIYYRLRTVKS